MKQAKEVSRGQCCAVQLTVLSAELTVLFFRASGKDCPGLAFRLNARAVRFCRP